MVQEKICDAHLHLVQCSKKMDFASFNGFQSYFACTCAHEENEFYEQAKICKILPDKLGKKCSLNFAQSFGIHPQMPLLKNAGFLEKLLQEEKIDAIGEAGFDLFTQELKNQLDAQEIVWRIQLELAIKYKKPLVVHCRKALQYIYRDAALLKKVPSVLFHSFCGGIYEAKGILSKGINAYFSFGNQLLKGNKKSAECVKLLPLSCLLFETDAPFQTLKHEFFTNPLDVKNVYKKAFEIRYPEKKLELSEFCNEIFNTFLNCFKIC